MEETARAVRREVGLRFWSQRDLAERAGVSKATAVRILKGAPVSCYSLGCVLEVLDIELVPVRRREDGK